MAELLLVASLALLALTWAGYPLAMAMSARLFPRPVRRDGAARPLLSVIVAARDEASRLPRKLASILSQGWPDARLEVLVADDGSNDGTAAVLAAWAQRGVRSVRLPEPRGKAAALEAAVRSARGEILVLTDARQPLAAGALAALAAPFGDPAVGAVSGELGLPRGAANGMALYRRFDDRLRRLEARSGSCVGVTGALWAVRRALWTPLPEDTLLDDLLQPLAVARRGRRVVVAEEARVLDVASPDPAREWRRRARTLAGNFQLLRDHPWVLWPSSDPLWLRLAGHKLLRLLTPLLLGVLAAASVVLATRRPGDGRTLETAAQALCAAQAVCWTLALLGGRAPGVLAGPARACRAFAMVNGAVLLGLWSVLRRRERALWRGAEEWPSVPRGGAV